MDNFEKNLTEACNAYADVQHDLEIFMDGIHQWFYKHRTLRPNIIHSVKSRLKNIDHLREKIARKWNPDNPITKDNLFQKITDLAGVRVLHLYQHQFIYIHEAILKRQTSNDWFFAENPMAYTWDPESEKFFKNLGLEVESRETHYTSVHYLIRPRPDSPLCCEVQVRTLFEEIWGEVDHVINYPEKSKSLSCREQLMVLTKLAGAGSRLVDSIFRVQREMNEAANQNDKRP
ncbi:MAG: RelA/SpoT domain-containing protein [Magnetococcales bacterium]|nr:RelA/SpoT domain-containing protein [Magnetococcales bacterium]